MPPLSRIILGPLSLDIAPLLPPRRKPASSLFSLSASVASPFSSASVENLCIDLRDAVTFRRRLRRFLSREDEGAVALQFALPHFDISLASRFQDSVAAEIRISPDLRSERHTYEFESTFPEVSAFADAWDLALLSLHS